MNIDVDLHLPGEAESVNVIRDVVGQALAAVGVTADCVSDIVLGLGEACTNVVDHAAPGDDYEVCVRFDLARCTISVRDEGGGFDVDGLQRGLPDPSAEHGRGVAIMCAVMDQVDLAVEPEGGTVVKLVKLLTLDPTGPLTRFTDRG